MKNIITAALCFAFFSACSGTPKKTYSPQPLSQNSSQSSTAELELNWSPLHNKPAEFVLPISHFLITTEGDTVLIDKDGKSFVLKSGETTLTMLNPITFSKGDSQTLTQLQISESDAWRLNGSRIELFHRGGNENDYQITNINLAGLFKDPINKQVELRSPRPEQILLIRGDEKISLHKLDGQFKMSRFLHSENSQFYMTSTGQLFSHTQAELKILIPGTTPIWKKQKIKHTALSEKDVSVMKFDITGNMNELLLQGIALLGEQIWISSTVKIANLGTQETSSVATDSDAQYQTTVEPFLVKYCASCHEGRTPVLISTEGGMKRSIKSAVIAQKDSIKFRLTLPRSDARSMPAYAPYPTPTELESVLKWLDSK